MIYKLKEIGVRLVFTWKLLGNKKAPTKIRFISAMPIAKEMKVFLQQYTPNCIAIIKALYRTAKLLMNCSNEFYH